MLYVAYFSFSNIFQVRDGGSMRDPVVTINSSTTQLLSRTNYLWIRFVYTVNKTANLKTSNATTFSFSLNYTTHSEYYFLLASYNRVFPDLLLIK